MNSVDERARIVSELKRLTEANGGRPPGAKRFTEMSGFGKYNWGGKHWARWSDLCEEAGVAVGAFTPRGDDDAQLTALAQLVRELGHFPTGAEMMLRRKEEPDFPSSVVFSRKLGRKVDQAEALALWCETRDGFEDVASICRRTVTTLEPSDRPDSPDARTAPGTVYMIKAGSHYKIGMSTRAGGRRHREISLQLPEKAHLIHEITTDDAAGIEAYWHRRFADRRRNGEWFELDRADVNAFKSRRSM
jgi:hypothetical protein